MNAICTVIAVNYIPQALTLETSLKRFHPHDDFYVLVIDSTSRDIPNFKYAKILIASDLMTDKNYFKDLISSYDLFEASTAVKATFLKTILTKGYDKVIFIDPDTELFHSLDSVFAILKEHSIVLTPHRLTPLKSDALTWKEENLLRYGSFNLGFIAVNRGAASFLDWWEKKLRWFCRRYYRDAVYTDQKWIDLVPSYFPFYCLRDLGYNLAPWNLDERPLAYSQFGDLMINSTRLVFIHYSQMSSALAKGEPVNVWQQYSQGMEVNELSLKIVQNLTENYANNLRKNLELATSKDVPKLKWPKQSYHLRAFYINTRGETSIVIRLKLTLFRLIDPFICKLERFKTFNSFIDDSMKDWDRLRVKSEQMYLKKGKKSSHFR